MPFGPISKIDLLNKTKYPSTTLSRMINDLLKNKYIVESGTQETSSVGRPPILYQVKEDCGFIIGIELNRLKTKIVLFDLLFNEIDNVSFIMTSKHSPQVVINSIKTSINRLIEQHNLETKNLLGIGIGTIGELDRLKGVILESNPMSSSGWKNVPIVEELQEEFPVKVILDISSHTSLLGEYQYVSNYDDVLYCYSGWQLGFGAITNGELLITKKGNRTDYGHINVNVNGRQCDCGKRGCLITYTSPFSLLKEVVSKTANLSEDITNSKDFFDVVNLLKQEKYFTNEIMKESAFYFGLGLSNIIKVLQSELVILNGSLIGAHPYYFEKIKHFTLEHLNEHNKVVFSKGELKEKASTVGSAILIFNSYFKKGLKYSEY